jgi:hypothetical protein
VFPTAAHIFPKYIFCYAAYHNDLNVHYCRHGTGIEKSVAHNVGYEHMTLRSRGY